jgi:hypothetical protein
MRYGTQGVRKCATAAAEEKPKGLNARLASVYYAPIVGPLFFGTCFTTLVCNSLDFRRFIDEYISNDLVQLIREKCGFDDEDEHLRVVNIETLAAQQLPVSVMLTFKDGSTKLVDDVPGSMCVADFIELLSQQPGIEVEEIWSIVFGEVVSENGTLDDQASSWSSSWSSSSSSSWSSSSSSSWSSSIKPIDWNQNLWSTPQSLKDNTIVSEVLFGRYNTGLSRVAAKDTRMANGVLAGTVRLDPGVGLEESERAKKSKVASCEAALAGLSNERLTGLRPIDTLDAEIAAMKAQLRQLKGSWF